MNISRTSHVRALFSWLAWSLERVAQTVLDLVLLFCHTANPDAWDCLLMLSFPNNTLACQRLLFHDGHPAVEANFERCWQGSIVG